MEMERRRSEKIVRHVQKSIEKYVCEDVEMEYCDMEKSVIIEMIMDMMGSVHLSVRKRKILEHIVEIKWWRNERNVICEVVMEIQCVIRNVGNR